MSLTITFGGWVIPAAFTLIVWLVALLATSRISGPHNAGDIGPAIEGAAYVIAALVATLAAWLLFFIIV